ncbi:RCC1 domain-containing protein [Myxococcota bacterium]
MRRVLIFVVAAAVLMACGADGGDDGVCGDGVRNGEEVCDGEDVAGLTCADLGHFGGDLGCASDCMGYDVTDCYSTLCGNGTTDPGEECDGDDLGGESCESLGYAGGDLSCNEHCTRDTTGCEAPVTCGDGAVQAPEECDEADLSQQSCESLGYGSGTLACDSSCLFDVSGCVPEPTCGNGAIEPGEECDDGPNNSDTDPDACRTDCRGAWCGDLVIDTNEECDWTNLDGNGCEDLGFAGGILLCAVDCSYDTSQCSSCGNGIQEPGEECDGSDLGSSTCASLGFDAGPLACDPACALDTSGCRLCGNGAIEPGEVCDGLDLGGDTCATIAGHADGALACASDCLSFVTSDCSTCGDGIIDGNEGCDGSNLGGATCFSETGLVHGGLVCAGCSLDTSGCHTCGNATLEGPEQCDGSNYGGETCLSVTGHSDGGLSCQADCLSIISSDCHTCGNNTIEGSEECDNSDLAGQTCQTVAGLASGSLGCNAACAFDTSACYECGNGMIDGPELCDGGDFGPRTCQTEAGHQDGSLTCNPGCFSIDTSGCHTCGDSQIEGPEDCDAFNPGTATCQSLGHSGGWVTCGTDCFYDESGCWDCGNGVCEHDIGETWQNCSQDCGWVTIAAGDKHTCAAKADGSAWCWGATANGQLLGDCDNSHQTCQFAGDCSPEPILVPGLANIISLSLSDLHTCARSSSGDVWCWGRGTYGQLGAGLAASSCLPVQVVGLPAATDIDVGNYYSCAVTILNTIGCWGLNNLGQLGDGTTNNSSVPVPSINLPPVIDVSACTHDSSQTCAAASDGTAWCWGRNGYGQLGDGSDTDSILPVQVVDPLDPTGYLQGAIQVGTGYGHSCALKSDGTVWCWGLDGNWGGLGDGQSHSDCGAFDCSYTPVQVLGIIDATHLACAEYSTCVLTAGGEIWCWGTNTRGGLGDGTTATRETPVQVIGINNAIIVTTGRLTAHSCAVLTDGGAWCWGNNDNGQLGDGTDVIERLSPVQVVGP